ncbi:hypothetical protein BDN72DRAFT_436435 [Pluteus cervinus]|uniref:Uncharacterized protein n=1 Tax=Pluteus cervinus TaxID=181527 RepID=A0ACD3B0C4_9AGAR|nr:hypothetical protein BDN72DRAFT_436435 [Pluteus cervinus]
MDIDTISEGLSAPGPGANPRLPPEIEYEIFVFAYHDADSSGRVILLRVAKRVSEWVIPLLYRVIVLEQQCPDIDPASQFRPFGRYPPISNLRRYGHHVRHLFVMNTTLTPFYLEKIDLLSSCPNVTNLAFWYGASLTPDAFNLPITPSSLRGVQKSHT